MSETRGRRMPGGHMGMGPGAGGAKAKDFRGSMKKLFVYLGRFRFQLFLTVLFAVAGTVFNVAGPKILSKATTELFNGLIGKLRGGDGIDFGKVGRILLILLAVYAAGALFSLIQNWIMTGVTQKSMYMLRLEISKKIGRMPMSYFESNQTGDTLSRITNDVDTLGQSMNQSIPTLISSVTTMAGVVIMMLTINVILTLIVLIMVPLSGVLMAAVMKKSQKYFQNQQKYLGDLDGKVEEAFSAQNVIQVFNHEEETLGDFDKTNHQLYEAGWKSQFLSGLLQPITQFVGNLGYVAVAVFGSIFAAAGTIQVGDIQAFIQYVRSFTQPITQIAQSAMMLQMMAASAERVFEFLEAKEEVPDQKDCAAKENIKGEVGFEHVKFGYDPDKVIIHDFTEHVKKGQMIAIVGPTGAGKTTLVKLLMRFYDVNDGRILLDGTDIREYARADLRRNFGMVMQDTWLFSGTVMENIRYGRPDATDEEVIAAAKTAHADHFIRTLPGGYDMVLNEEASNVSQGQKQLLTIARALLADSPIMILDEATSSVDTMTEQRIQRGIRHLLEGRTSFVIAHRLSTIRNADLILVLRDGDIVEQGTHEELLSADGFYAQLYNSQFENLA